MGKKVCGKCQEVNSASAMFCSNCYNSLSDAPVIEDGKLKSDLYQSFIRDDSSRERIQYAGTDQEVTIGTWIAIMLVTAVPVVGFIALLVIAFGNFNDSIKNYAKASLILSAIGIGLGVMIIACSRSLY